MKVYFLSSMPCVLTVNGAYFGIVDTFERFADVSLKDRLCIRFIPENAQPITFFLTEDILFRPPQGCEVYKSKDALSIYAKHFPTTDCTLRVITQKRFDNKLVTVFCQGEVQASFQTQENFFIAYLPPSFSVCEVFFEHDLFFLRSPKALAVYAQNGKQLLCENVLSHRIENGVLSARLPLSDHLGRYLDCEWKIDDAQLIQTAHTLVQTRTADGATDENRIKEELLAYAFFESILIGGDYQTFLCEELLSSAEKITAYLGEYTHVLITDTPTVCGLVYPQAERLFRVDYFHVSIQNGKITDISPA